MSRYDVPPLVEEQSRVTAVVPDGPSAGVPPLVAAGYPHRTSWLEDGPTHGAVVFSFDEKTQCEALDRTQPSLPMTPGRAETMTYACKRNGITDLFVAMNVATGEVIYDTKPRHSAKEVLAFFKSINVHVPEHLEVHVVLDNLSANKAPPVANWLAHPKRVRWHLHFTTTSSSWWWWWWLNLVECWFSLLTARRLKTRCVHQRRRAYRSDRALGRTLERQSQGVHLEEDSRRDHRQGPTRPRCSNHPNQIRDTPLGRF